MESSIILLNQKNIERIFNNWKIKIMKNIDSIVLKIEDNLNIYESSFRLTYLQSFNLLSPNQSIDDIINCIISYIDNNKINIEEQQKSIKLIFLSNNTSNEIIIQEKHKLNEEIIDKLINEIKTLKEENKKLEIRIKNLEKDKININNILKINKIQLTNCNPKKINSIESHTSSINSLSKFPSGNIISVSSDKSIKIYDTNLNIIQNISNAHDNGINYISIKDENNFATCSKDKNIKTWIKKKIIGKFKDEYSFKLNQIINNAHNDWINKIIYCLDGNLISCSRDKKIKIWEENNNDKYECIKILKHNDWIYSILLLEDKNILISSGGDGIKVWNLKDYENILEIKEAICWNRNALERIDEDKIIIGGYDDKILKIISLQEKKIIKQIKNDFECFGICIIQTKGVFLIGGESKEIKIYRSDNYKCIKTIKEAYFGEIYGINELKDGSIAIYGLEKTINIWSF